MRTCRRRPGYSHSTVYLRLANASKGTHVNIRIQFLMTAHMISEYLHCNLRRQSYVLACAGIAKVLSLRRLPGCPVGIAKLIHLVECFSNDLIHFWCSHTIWWRRGSGEKQGNTRTRESVRARERWRATQPPLCTLIKECVLIVTFLLYLSSSMGIKRALRWLSGRKREKQINFCVIEWNLWFKFFISWCHIWKM